MFRLRIVQVSSDLGTVWPPLSACYPWLLLVILLSVTLCLSKLASIDGKVGSSELPVLLLSSYPQMLPAFVHKFLSWRVKLWLPALSCWASLWQWFRIVSVDICRLRNTMSWVGSSWDFLRLMVNPKHWIISPVPSSAERSRSPCSWTTSRCRPG